MKNGILYKYENKEFNEYKVSLIRKGGRNIIIHTNKGIKLFDCEKDSYTEEELLNFLKD